MALNSQYGSSARKQLVRPFLSSPVALFAYLLLILSGVGLLEWVLRASAAAHVKHDLEIRAAWLDEYYSKAALLPKHAVPAVRPAPRSVGILRRQSGNLDPPSTTTSDTPSFSTPAPPPSTTTTSSSPTTASFGTTTSTSVLFTTTSSSSVSVTLSRTTTSSLVSLITTTNPSPPSSTTTSTSFRTTTSISVPLTTTTIPATSSSTTLSPSGKETTTAASSLTLITITSTTTTRSSLIPQLDTTTTTTASTGTSTISFSLSSTTLTLSTSQSTILSTSKFVSTTTVLNESVPTSDFSRSPSLSSSNTESRSQPSATSSLSGTVFQNIFDSSVALTSEQIVSATSIYRSVTTPVFTTSSSTGRASTQQQVAIPASTTTPTAIKSSASIESIANMASTTVSNGIITTSVSPTKISSIQESVATSTAPFVNTCHHGFVCLFANRNLAVPLKDGYRILPMSADVLGEFGATYASIIIVLLFQSFWLIIYASIRLNEPFHQLAQPQYTTLEVGLLFEFLVIGLPMDHFKSGFRGNWSSWYIITAYMVLLMTMIAPSLAAEAFSVQNLKVYCGKGSTSKDCVRRIWTVAPGPVRALQILLVMVALLVSIVLVVRIYRGSALSLKKVSLALIATTLSDFHTTSFLHDVNPGAPPKESVPFLQTRSWALEPSIATEIGTEHGSYILRSRSERNPTAQQVYSAYAERNSKRQGPPRPLMNLLIPAFIIVLLIILVITYTVNGIDDSKLTVFFGSVSFGPKFLLVSISTILGIALSRVENEVRVLTPYRSLQGVSNPQSLLTRRLHPSPLTQAFAALKHGEWVSAFISFMTGYGVNVLAMTISNIPYHPGRSVSGTIICIFVTLSLLILMAVALLVVAFWRRGNSNLGIQRWPTTLADIYILMVHSRIPGVEGIHGVETRDQDMVEFYGEPYDKKAMVIQRTVEVEE